MEGSLLACQADDCNYDKLKHDTAHCDSLMKAFIGWSTKQRQHPCSPSMCARVCESGVGDLMCVYPCASLPVHAVFLEKHVDVCDDTLRFRRGGFASCRFTAYPSVG